MPTGGRLKIYWYMRVSNEKVYMRANTDTISEVVKKRWWILIGHVLRMDNSSLPLPYGEKELIMMMMMKNVLNSLFWHTGEVGEQHKQDWFAEGDCRTSYIQLWCNPIVKLLFFFL